MDILFLRALPTFQKMAAVLKIDAHGHATLFGFENEQWVPFFHESPETRYSETTYNVTNNLVAIKVWKLGGESTTLYPFSYQRINAIALPPQIIFTGGGKSYLGNSQHQDGIWSIDLSLSLQFVNTPVLLSAIFTTAQHKAKA